MDIFFYIDRLLILAFSIAITIYFTLKKIVCFKSILFLFFLGVVLLILQFSFNLYLVSDYGPFDSISLRDVLMLKLGPYDRFMLTSYTMFMSFIACTFVKIISIMLGQDIGSECDGNDDEEVKEDGSN